MKTLLEHLQKCQSLFGLQKSIAAKPLSVDSSSNTGVKNIVYKQKTGTTSPVSKKAISSPMIKPVTDIKPIASMGSNHLRLGGNKLANTGV
jgi:hypothetical protein